MLTRHALVVDDDTDGREALAEILEAQGYTVRQAANGRIAIDLIGERVPCLMLLDLEMPVMSGWEVLAWIQHDSAQPAMAIVVLSAAASAPPNVTFVRKPCEVDQLLETIRACRELLNRAVTDGRGSPGGQGGRAQVPTPPSEV